MLHLLIQVRFELAAMKIVIESSKEFADHAG
jgi:hypothetical protein